VELWNSFTALFRLDSLTFPLRRSLPVFRTEVVQVVIAEHTLFAQSSAGLVFELELPPHPLASRTAAKTAASAASLVVETAMRRVSSPATVRVKEVERPPQAA